MRLLVDGMNVIGSRPDGWWRDRAQAQRDLVARLEVLEPGPGALVVTSDRELRARAERAGAEVVGASWLLARVPS